MKKILITLISLAGTLSAQTSLDEYLEMARQNNPGLKARKEEFEAAMQRVTQMGALPDPEFSVASFGQMVETRVGQQMARLSLSQMFPWFGTLAAQKNAAAISAEAIFDSYRDAQNELSFKVRMAYYPLVEIQQLIQLQEKNLEIYSTFKTLATSKFQNGKGKLADALRVDIMANDLKTEIAILNQKKKPLEVAFNKLLNRPADESIAIQEDFEVRADQLFTSDSIESNNPKLIELDKRISAARAQEAVAIKQGMPRLGIGFEYFVTARRTDAVIADNGKDAWMPMLTMSLPIYRNKYRAAASEARHMQQSYVEMRNEVNNQLNSEFEMAVFERSKAKQEMELFDKQIEQTQQVIDLLLTGYGNSETDFEEILMMQQSLLKYKMNKVTSAREYLNAEARLKFLIAR